MNVIVWLEFELVYYGVAVQYVSHNSMGTPILYIKDSHLLFCDLTHDIIPIYLSIYASHQTSLDTRSMTRRPIKVGMRRRSGRNRGSNPAGLCCSSTHLVQCESDEPSLSEGVNNAAHLPRGSLAETGSLTASSLPLFLFGATLWTKVQREFWRAKRNLSIYLSIYHILLLSAPKHDVFSNAHE